MTCCRVHSVVDPAARVLRSPSMSLDAHARPTRAVAFTIATVLLAAALLGQLVRVHSLRGDHAISSIAFGVLTVLLVLSEIHPTTWTRVGERDGVTRGWAFAYALILLGNPILAITVMVAVRCYVNLSRGKSPVEIGFNSAQITASLSMGGLVLAYFGVHGNIARAGTMTIGECVGIVFGGLAIFGLNGIMTATVIGLEQDAGFLARRPGCVRSERNGRRRPPRPRADLRDCGRIPDRRTAARRHHRRAGLPIGPRLTPQPPPRTQRPAHASARPRHVRSPTR